MATLALPSWKANAQGTIDHPCRTRDGAQFGGLSDQSGSQASASSGASYIGSNGPFVDASPAHILCPRFLCFLVHLSIIADYSMQQSVFGCSPRWEGLRPPRGESQKKPNVRRASRRDQRVERLQLQIESPKVSIMRRGGADGGSGGDFLVENRSSVHRALSQDRGESAAGALGNTPSPKRAIASSLKDVRRSPNRRTLIRSLALEPERLENLKSNPPVCHSSSWAPSTLAAIDEHHLPRARA